MDQLNALPYLDMVVRETLRVHPPVPATGRVSMRDGVLPLSNPVTDRKGRVHHTIRKVNPQIFYLVYHVFYPNSIKKGQIVQIPIIPVNMDKSIWGGDADEFRQVISIGC